MRVPPYKSREYQRNLRRLISVNRRKMRKSKKYKVGICESCKREKKLTDHHVYGKKYFKIQLVCRYCHLLHNRLGVLGVINYKKLKRRERYIENKKGILK